MIVRPYRPEDAAAVLAIHNVVSAPVLTLEQFRERDARWDPRRFHLRLVAERDGAIPGFAWLANTLFNAPGWVSSGIYVAPESRGQGVGQALASALEEAIASNGFAGLDLSVRDNDPESRTWAERRGFTYDGHRFESVLKVQECDLAPHAATVARAEAAGVRFLTLAEAAGGSPAPELWQRAYDLFARLCAQAPDLEGLPAPDWEFFHRTFVVNPYASPERFFLAKRDGRFIALSVLLLRGPKVIYTYFTGVDPSARGLGLGRAIKVKTIEHAQQGGFAEMVTNNLSTNAPMLAINDALGYRRLPGFWLLKRRFG